MWYHMTSHMTIQGVWLTLFVRMLLTLLFGRPANSEGKGQDIGNVHWGYTGTFRLIKSYRVS